MLIDFTVANFRSIRDPVTWSLVEVAPGKSRQKGPTRKRELSTDDQISPALDVPGWDFKLLRSSCIYGANASGKSNVVRALIALLDLLVDGPEYAGFKDAFRVFRLEPMFADRPTVFRFHAAGDFEEANRAIYAYEVHLLRGVVVEEHLTVETKGHVQEAFSRIMEKDGQRTAVFSDLIPVAIREMEAALDPQVPLLHVLVRNFALPGLQSLRSWLRHSSGYGVDSSYIAGIMTKIWMKDQQFADAVSSFVKDHDTMLDDVRVELDSDQRVGRLLAIHATPVGEIVWDVADESAGTRRLLEYSGPILRALKEGSLLVLDEFGAHLHPHITERIVALFQSPETNPRGAQLLFNTHETYLLDNERLRRDQVWFTEKHPDGHTELFPLSDFHMRKDAGLGRAYLGGSLGAVPVLPPAPRRPEAA